VILCANLKPKLPTTKDKQNAIGQAIIKCFVQVISQNIVKPSSIKLKIPVIKNAIIRGMKNCAKIIVFLFCMIVIQVLDGG